MDQDGSAGGDQETPDDLRIRFSLTNDFDEARYILTSGSECLAVEVRRCEDCRVLNVEESEQGNCIEDNSCEQAVQAHFTRVSPGESVTIETTISRSHELAEAFAVLGVALNDALGGCSDQTCSGPSRKAELGHEVDELCSALDSSPMRVEPGDTEVEFSLSDLFPL